MICPLNFGVHAAAYTVAIQLADPGGAARSLDRLHAIADQIGAPHMTWTVGWYETIGAGPVQLTFYLARAIVSVARG